MALSALGRGSRGEGRGRERAESEGRGRGGRGACPDASGRLGGKQEVARVASALATELLRGEGEEDDREEEALVGWAVRLQCWAKVK